MAVYRILRMNSISFQVISRDYNPHWVPQYWPFVSEWAQITINKTRIKPVCEESAEVPQPFFIQHSWYSYQFLFWKNVSLGESFLLDRSPDIIAPCESNLNSLIFTTELSVHDNFPLYRKESNVYMHDFDVCVRENLPIQLGLFPFLHYHSLLL